MCAFRVCLLRCVRDRWGDMYTRRAYTLYRCVYESGPTHDIDVHTRERAYTRHRCVYEREKPTPYIDVYAREPTHEIHVYRRERAFTW